MYVCVVRVLCFVRACVCMMHNTSCLAIQKVEFRNPKMAWITDMVVITDEHKMIFSSIDNSLGITE